MSQIGTLARQASLAGCLLLAACTSATSTPTEMLSHSTLSVSPSRLPASGTDSATVNVALVDDNGAVMTGWQVLLSADSAAAQVTQPANTNLSGITTGALSSTTPGTVTVSAVAVHGQERIPLSPTAQVTFTPSTQLSVALSSASSSAIAGQPGTLTITARDGTGAPVPTFTGTVVITCSDPCAQVPPVYTFSLLDQGSHQFVNGLTLKRAGSVRIDAADSTGAAASGSTSVSVSAGPARAFAITPSAHALTSTVATTATVSALDAQGNVATGYLGIVHFSSTDPNAQLPSDTPLGTDQATRPVRFAFSSVGAQTLTVADLDNPTLAPGTDVFTVAAGPPKQLRFVQAPSQGSACAPLGAAQVQVLDAGGNPLANPNTAVTLALQGAPAGSLAGTLTQPVQQGNALFADLSVPSAQSGRWVATAPNLASATGPAFAATDSPPRITALNAPFGSACEPISYTLQQDCGAPTDLDVAYSLDGVHYLPATQAGAHAAGIQGRVAVPSSAQGLARSFLWDASRDLGSVNTGVTLRLQGRSRGLLGSASYSGGLFMPLGPSWAARRDADAGAPQSCLALDDFNGDGRLDVATCRSASQVAVWAGDGNGVFGAPSLFAVGNGPRALRSADMNRDGAADLVALNTGDGTLTLLTGHDDGTFTPGAAFTVGAGAVAMAIDDIDRDGRLDYATLTATGTGPTQFNLNWVRGNGSGGLLGSPNTLALASDSTTLQCSPGNCSPQRLALADLNEDGLLDALVVEEVQQQLLFARGTGTGFLPPAPTGTAGTPTHVATADLNSDGHLDVIVGIAGGTVEVFLGLGSGVLQSARVVATGAPIASLGTGDLDGDGHLDVLLVSSTGAAQVLAGDGYGNLASEVILALPNGPTMAQVADVNGDAQLDVVATASSGALSTVLSARARPCSWDLAAPQAVPAGDRPRLLLLGDYDSDGKVDVWAAQDGNASASLLLGRGDGLLTASAALPLAAAATAAVARDVNGDGLLDLLALNPNTGLQTLLGDGNAFLTAGANGAPGASPQAAGAHPVALAVADLDGDGLLDVAAVSDTSPGVVTVLLGDGHGAWHAGTPASTANQPRWIAAGDLDGDGHVDLMTAHASGTLSLLTGVGGGIFNLPVTGNAMDSGPVGLALADVDGDGRLDAISASADLSTLTLRLGQAGGGFGPKTSTALPAAPTSLTVQDLDGDGLPEWLATSVGAELTVGNNVGGGGFGVHHYSNDAGATSVAVADLDSDGALDAITANPNSHRVTLLRGDPAAPGHFLAAATSHLGADPEAMALVDFNHDGQRDALVVSAGSSTLSFNAGSPTGLAPYGVSVPTGAGAISLAVADVNRDGWLDVLTQSSGTNALTVHLSSRGGSLGAGLGQVSCARATRLCVADFDRNGVLDVAVACPQDQSILVLTGVGDGSFSGSSYWPASASLTPQFNDLACVDVNADGAPDVVITDGSNGRLMTFLGDGAGSYASIQTVSGLAQPAGLAVGDVNRDGRVDLAVSSSAGIYLAPGQSGSALFPFATWTLVAPATGVERVTLVDADNDGLLDLLAPSASSSTVQVLRGDGNSLLAGPVWVSGQGALQAGLGASSAGWGRRDLWLINRQDSSLTALKAR